MRVRNRISGPSAFLNYRYGANGNLTKLSSATTNGVSTGYQYDALNRLTNVVDIRGELGPIVLVNLMLVQLQLCILMLKA
jgi:YD repeat-containing protein